MSLLVLSKSGGLYLVEGVFLREQLKKGDSDCEH